MTEIIKMPDLESEQLEEINKSTLMETANGLLFNARAGIPEQNV